MFSLDARYTVNFAPSAILPIVLAQQGIVNRFYKGRLRLRPGLALNTLTTSTPAFTLLKEPHGRFRLLFHR
jgi:hypothetical protein